MVRHDRLDGEFGSRECGVGNPADAEAELLVPRARPSRNQSITLLDVSGSLVDDEADALSSARSSSSGLRRTAEVRGSRLLRRYVADAPDDDVAGRRTELNGSVGRMVRPRVEDGHHQEHQVPVLRGLRRMADVRDSEIRRRRERSLGAERCARRCAGQHESGQQAPPRNRRSTPIAWNVCVLCSSGRLGLTDGTTKTGRSVRRAAHQAFNAAAIFPTVAYVPLPCTRPSAEAPGELVLAGTSRWTWMVRSSD